MRVGIAGTGRIGSAHATALSAHDTVRELVVHDENVARATEVAARVGGTVAKTMSELFGAGLDAVVIATATSAHADLIEAASAWGVPVFCEKPVALDAKRTREVRDHVAKTGVPVQIGFQRRFDDGYTAARRALQAGELGELRRVHLVSADPAPPDASYIPTSGGIFRDLHIHDFDILRWMTGREVVEVYATGANRGAGFFGDVDDVDESAALLVLDDGTLATLQGSRYNGAGYDIRLEIAGTRATHVVGLSDRSPLRSSEPGVTFPAGPPWVPFWERFERSYAAELHAFINVAEGRRDSPCTVADALESFYVAEAADLSRHEHRPVQVAEVQSG